MLTIHWGASQSQRCIHCIPPKKNAQGFGEVSSLLKQIEVSHESLPSKMKLPGWAMALVPLRVRIFLKGASQPNDALLKGGLEKRGPSSQLDLDSLKARIGWPSPNVTRAPLVGDSQYLHRILLAPKPKKTSYIDIACPRENQIWVVNSSAAVHRPATGVALASDFFCQQKFLVAVNLLMRKSGFWNLFCHVSYLAAHPLRWPETQAVDCEVESCMRGVQSTATGFPHQHLHSLFSPAGCYYEVSTNATSCSSTGKETPEVVLANKQHWNRHLDVLVEALHWSSRCLASDGNSIWNQYHVGPLVLFQNKAKSNAILSTNGSHTGFS